MRICPGRNHVSGLSLQNLSPEIWHHIFLFLCKQSYFFGCIPDASTLYTYLQMDNLNSHVKSTRLFRWRKIVSDYETNGIYRMLHMPSTVSYYRDCYRDMCEALYKWGDLHKIFLTCIARNHIVFNDDDGSTIYHTIGVLLWDNRYFLIYSVDDCACVIWSSPCTKKLF